MNIFFNKVLDILKKESIVVDENFYNNNEFVLIVNSNLIKETLITLRDDKNLKFTQLVDLCAIDYSSYSGKKKMSHRFCLVYNILSMNFNKRLRIKVFCKDEISPEIDSIVDVYPCADWYEREAFDLFGIIFLGHPDLRRILTDYGFIGFPFRKDFPLSGHLEMRYDPEKKRVIYQPVTIEPREVIPRVVRENNYGKN